MEGIEKHAAEETKDTVDDVLQRHGEAFTSFLEEVQANILGTVSEYSVGPQGFVENVQAFRHAVDWDERWIQAVLAFHATLFIIFLLRRKHFGTQVGLFVVILVGARSSELINTYLGNRWHEFSRQNYFDKHGIFMGVMWAGPLLLLGFIMLINLLCQAASLLVTVKAEQFKREIAAKKAAGKGKAKRSAKGKQE